MAESGAGSRMVTMGPMPAIPSEDSRAQEELVELTLLVRAINTWNRIGIGFRAVHPVKTARAA